MEKLNPKYEICNHIARLLEKAADLPDTIEDTTDSWMDLRDIRDYTDLSILSIERIKERIKNEAQNQDPTKP